MNLNILNGYEHQSPEQPKTGNWPVLKDSIVMRSFTSNPSNHKQDILHDVSRFDTARSTRGMSSLMCPWRAHHGKNYNRSPLFPLAANRRRVNLPC